MRSDKTIIIMNYDYEENRGNRRRPTYVELHMYRRVLSTVVGLCTSSRQESPTRHFVLLRRVCI
jgi:hypothetical protein